MIDLNNGIAIVGGSRKMVFLSINKLIMGDIRDSSNF